MKSVLFITNLPSPYIVDFLNELGKKCDLLAVFERKNSNVRDKSWSDYQFVNFKGVVLSGINIKVNEDLDDQAISPQIIRYIRKNCYDSIIVANPCTPTGIIAIMYMKLMHIPYTIQSEGGFPGEGNGIKEKIKKIIFRNAKNYLSTASVGDAYFMKYGARREQIKRFPFSSLYDKDILNDLVDDNEKENLKKELNIPYKKIVISIGRFIKIKGFEGLIEASVGLDMDVGVYIIGGKPTERYLELCKEKKLKNIHFVEFVDKETVKKYYKIADVFVLNTHGDTWGLVINEAMSFGLPVISTDKCYAALALIINGVNGYVIKPDDIDVLHQRMREVLLDETLKRKMGYNNIEKSKQYTIESMANAIYNNVINE